MGATSDWKLKIAIKALYFALIHPILKYSSIIWSPRSASDACQTERVQRKFSWLAGFTSSYNTYVNHSPRDYQPVADLLKSWTR